MAYMNQERKKQIKAELDKILKPAKIKFTLGVRNHSTIVLNINSGPIDFISNYNSNASNMENSRNVVLHHATNYIDLNPYWYHEHFTGEVLELLKKVFAALNNGNHDRSEPQVDYFDVGWYVDVNIGKWDKPYQLVK